MSIKIKMAPGKPPKLPGQVKTPKLPKPTRGFEFLGGAI